MGHASFCSRHVFAGCWLVFAGIAHFGVMNWIADANSVRTLDWSPMALVLIGILVANKIRAAVLLVRLFGALVLVGLSFAVVLSMAGIAGEVTYGSIKITDPALWQILLMLLAVSITLIPPWYE
jgi:hypothetical protein